MGPLLVPFLTLGLNYPIHIAAATSLMTVALTSLGAAALSVSQGSFVPAYALALSLGVLAGSPAGAWLSTRVGARSLTWLMSGLLFFLGIRLMV